MSSFSIYTDQGDDDWQLLPTGLSDFFEQHREYGETSEAAQLAKLLDVDLSVFQQPDVAEENEPSTWHELSAIRTTVDRLIEKIDADPEFYTKVQYGEAEGMDMSELFDLARGGNMDEMLERVQNKIAELQDKPVSGFPPDNGYLSGGSFSEDLLIFRRMLAELEKNGVKKVRLVYG